MTDEIFKRRLEQNIKTLDKIEELVNDAIFKNLDIYRVIAMYVFDCRYDDDVARNRIKKFMIPGSDKSYMTIPEFMTAEKMIEEKFPFILDCDVYEDDIRSSDKKDGTMEALYLILPMYRFKFWDKFNHNRLDEFKNTVG
jgi:hypothetical protein